jgi:MoaA/NifB/PqqE/SkfB family radical SAM enzyme
MWPDWAAAGGRGAKNYVRGLPLCVSIEVTHGCTADCRHCNLGGLLASERRASPQEYAALLRAVGPPPVIQISGGEPLSRPDVVEIVRAVRGIDSVPFIIVVTNGSLLEPGVYQRLSEAGASRFSISLDFPDERHDAFRRCPGLFKHLSTVLPAIARMHGGGCNVALNTAITKANFREIVNIARLAQDWGVGVAYSAYTRMKTGDESFLLSADETRILARLIDEVLELKARGVQVLNPPSLLKRTIRYFADGQIPHCGAGKRFLVIRPDGGVIPCSSFQEARYPSVDAMKAWVGRNTCSACYVAIRAYTDRTPLQFLADARHMLKAALSARSH